MLHQQLSKPPRSSDPDGNRRLASRSNVMSNYYYHLSTSLQLENKHLRDRIKRLESGEEFSRLRKIYEKEISKKDREISSLKKELAAAHSQIKTNRDHWMEVNEDVLAEAEKLAAQANKKLQDMEKKWHEMARQRDMALDEKAEMRKELYAVKSELLEAQDKITGLRAVVTKNSSNSSKPSSTDPNRKNISNSREKTGRLPGGQPGHEHHGRHRHEPDRIIKIPPEKEHLDDTKYTPTGKTIRKQVVGLRIYLDVTEYETPEFRDKTTGQRVHAPFPGGLRDDVTYDGTVKAAAFLLNNECNVSIEKTRRIFSEFTDGKLNLSAGLISDLKRQFSKKTVKEREEAYRELLSSPKIFTDFTFGRCNGKTSTILICANDDVCLYSVKPKKGNEGVKDSPLEFYDGTVISDHEAALVKCGSRHQECLSHVRRYAQGSIDNEPDKTWGKPLQQWITEAIDYRDQTIRDGGEYDQGEVEKLLRRYDEIIDLGIREYEEVPPNRYYKDGYNLIKRMKDDKEDYVLFLSDITIDPTNNRSERLARQYKRKNHQVITFRSDSGNEYYCDCLTFIQNAKAKGDNLYKASAAVFDS